MEDLAKGDTIMVTGTTSGTTVTAESIRKGELGMGRGFGGGPGQAPPAGGAPPGGSGSSGSTPTTTA